MMSLQISPQVSLMVLLLIYGAAAQAGWGVDYSPKSVCALKGSTVDISCTYTHPPDLSVQKAFWTKNESVGPGVEHPDLLDEVKYRDRVQYLRDKQPNSILRLRDVTEEDQRKYYFRFITDKEGEKWIGRDGVSLLVTDLQLEAPETVMEGVTVTLTCKTSCSLSDPPSFIWYRNKQPLSSSTEQLSLQEVSREHAGMYQCGVPGQNHRSPEVSLNVSYPPKNVSVSISPSGDIVENRSVTLTCSSDGNPPVKNYTWFKGASSVSGGETYTMNNIRPENSGEYKCRSSNKHGEKTSDTVTLNVLYPPKNVSVSISPSGDIVEDSSVTVTCSSDANPPVQNYTWFKEGGGSPVGSGDRYSALQSGSFYCEAQNKYGSQTSAAVTVKVFNSVVLYAVLGAVAGCGCLCLVVVLCLRRKRSEDDVKQDHIYSSVKLRSTTTVIASDAELTNQDEVQYASVIKKSKKAESPAVSPSAFRSDEEVQYATVRFTGPGAANRSAPSTLEDVSVIYSSVR